MNIPEFTAQASLYRTSNSYRSLAFDLASPKRTVVTPQLGGPGFEGKANCFMDCRDKHPKWTAERCGAYCRDPGGIRGSGGPPSCEASQAKCNLEFLACAAGLGPFGAALICPEFRDICLENSYRDNCLPSLSARLQSASLVQRQLFRT